MDKANAINKAVDFIIFIFIARYKNCSIAV